MNKANYLFDKEYVLKLLNEKVLPLYPEFTGIKDFDTHAYKKHIWVYLQPELPH